MARPAKFTDDDVLDAATEAIAAGGRDVTIDSIARALRAPTGSIYYRFASRETLLVTLWLRSIHRFHADLLAALRADAAPRAALIEAALTIPRFCRAHPDIALTMTLFRQQRLATSAPQGLREQVVTVNDEIASAIADVARAEWGRLSERRVELLTIAVQAGPYGLVRPYVGGPVPPWLDDVVRASSTAVLALV